MPTRINEEVKKEEKVEDGHIKIFMTNPPRYVTIPITRKTGKINSILNLLENEQSQNGKPFIKTIVDSFTCHYHDVK